MNRLSHRARPTGAALLALGLASLALATLWTGCEMLGLGAGDSGPRLEGLPGKIVYTHDDNLYLIDQDGTRRITDLGDDEGATDPAFSPDGERIAFSGCLGCTTLGASLYLIGTGGGGLRPLKRLPQDAPRFLVGSEPAWSPDGRRIAYSVCTNCELGGHDHQISVIEVAGEDYDPAAHHAVTEHPARDRAPTWSPDGKRIAFISNRAYLQRDSARWRTDLYVVDVDGTNLQRLTETGNVGPPIWSPDGSRIAFAWQHRGADVFIYEWSTGVIQRVTDLEAVGRPVWHPTGQQLLVPGTTHGGQRVWQLFSSEGEVLTTIGRPAGTRPDWFAEEDDLFEP